MQPAANGACRYIARLAARLGWPEGEKSEQCGRAGGGQKYFIGYVVGSDSFIVTISGVQG